jgi:hypothetical protein
MFFASLATIHGCTTVNLTFASGERNSIRATDSDAPTTQVNASANVPLR